MIGEQEVLKGNIYPIKVVAAKPRTKVFTLHKRDFDKVFTSKKEETKLINLMSTITFPTQDQVIRDIEVLKQVQKIKKFAFMNACDTNKLPRSI